MATKVPERYKKWQKKEDNLTQTKGAGGFSVVLTLNAKPLKAGRYRIQWNAEVRLQAGNTSLPKMRVMHGANRKGLKTFKSPDQEWDHWSGWDFDQYTDGETPTLTLEVKREGGSDTVEVRKLKLSIELMES